MTPKEFKSIKPGETFALWAVVIEERPGYVHKAFLEQDHAKEFIKKFPALLDRDSPVQKNLPFSVKRTHFIKDTNNQVYSIQAIVVDVWSDKDVRKFALSKLSDREKKVLGVEK